MVPFYHAYKLFSERMRQESQQLTFHLQPGDVVAFNNRRVMHGRGSYDPSKVERSVYRGSGEANGKCGQG